MVWQEHARSASEVLHQVSDRERPMIFNQLLGTRHRQRPQHRVREPTRCLVALGGEHDRQFRVQVMQPTAEAWRPRRIVRRNMLNRVGVTRSGERVLPPEPKPPPGASERSTCSANQPRSCAGSVNADMTRAVSAFGRGVITK